MTQSLWSPLSQPGSSFECLWNLDLITTHPPCYCGNTVIKSVCVWGICRIGVQRNKLSETKVINCYHGPKTITDTTERQRSPAAPASFFTSNVLQWQKISIGLMYPDGCFSTGRRSLDQCHCRGSWNTRKISTQILRGSYSCHLSNEYPGKWFLKYCCNVQIY